MQRSKLSFRFATAALLGAMLFSFGVIRAGAQGTLPPEPGSPRRQAPTGTIAPPGFSIQVQPGSGGIITGPGGGLVLSDTIEPAASASFEPSTTRVGRPIEYRVTITGNQRVLDLPALVTPDSLQLEPGPRGYSIMNLNGEAVGTSTLRFTAVALRAGEHVIPSFPVQIGNRRVQVPAATLVVTPQQPGEAVYQPVKAVIEVPQRDFFVGETIAARMLFIETPDEQPQNVQHVAKSSGGVLFKPILPTRREQFTWEGQTVNGLIMPVQITPLLAGETEVNCQVVILVGKNDPFGRRGILSQSTVDVPSVRFRVLPLPAVRPPGFTGAIGEFTVSQPKLSATEVEVGEPLTMHVALTGEGNLDGVPPPELENHADWTAYRPTSEIQRDNEAGAGTKIFTYTLIPRREGRNGTPALPFAYFDPVKRSFTDITIPPVPVVVKPSSSAPPTASSGAASAESPAPSEPPKEPEPTLTGLAETAGKWHQSPGPSFASVLWFQAIPPALLLALWLWRRRTEYLAKNPQILRRRKARAAARRELAAARSAAKRGDHAGFIAAGLGALREAAAPLDSARAESLTRAEVLRKLQTNERASRTAQTIFESADASRYATAKVETRPSSELLPDLEHAVAQLSARS